jgi:hypothetical protein
MYTGFGVAWLTRAPRWLRLHWPTVYWSRGSCSVSDRSLLCTPGIRAGESCVLERIVTLPRHHIDAGVLIRAREPKNGDHLLVLVAGQSARRSCEPPLRQSFDSSQRPPPKPCSEQARIYPLHHDSPRRQPAAALILGQVPASPAESTEIPRATHPRSGAPSPTTPERKAHQFSPYLAPHNCPDASTVSGDGHGGPCLAAVVGHEQLIDPQ